MEALAYLLIIVALYLLFSLKNTMSSKMAELNNRFDELSRQIQKFQNDKNAAVKSESKPATEYFTPKSVPQSTERIVPQERLVPEAPIRREEIKIPDPILPPAKPVEPPLVAKQIPPATTQPKEVMPGFFERNPDLEKFIGENLANKIGIAILVVGIGFFVKYAIDKEWINEMGRVLIGIVCGAILLGVAHKMRKTFSAFSSVLVGGGLAVLYFTIAIAFHEYEIFSQTAAFLLMVGITGFSVALALGYNRVELAVFAILGGFGSPFMVSTGEGNYIVLFTYILILNSGMLVLAYYKKWNIINIICYVFTIIIFGTWLSTRFDGDSGSMISGALTFATLFYLIFFVMNIINNIKENKKFEPLEMLMLMSNTFLYFSAGMAILNNAIAEDFKGLFTALLGVFNFVFAYVLLKKLQVDRNLVFMLIGLVLTFISLAAPIQLQGNYITLFWAAEGVLLLWLSQKSGIKLIKIASVIVMALMAISLIIDWKQIYMEQNEIHLNILFNKGYITSLVAIASLILTSRFLNNEKEQSFLPIKDYKIGITLICGLFLYVANLLEVRHHLNFYIEPWATREVMLGTYNMLFVFLLQLAENRLRLPAQIKNVFPAFGLLAMFSYFFYYHDIVIETRQNYLEGISPSTGFYFHYLFIILLIVNIVLSLKNLNKNTAFISQIRNAHWWLYIFFFVFLASAELDHLIVTSAYTTPESLTVLLNDTHKIGYPILWGITSFILIAVGLKLKIKTLRIISMSILLITLLKLFVVDLRDISEGGKIAAFISLGVLLLVVSFMYQRLKKLLLDDTPKA